MNNSNFDKNQTKSHAPSSEFAGKQATSTVRVLFPALDTLLPETTEFETPESSQSKDSLGSRRQESQEYNAVKPKQSPAFSTVSSSESRYEVGSQDDGLTDNEELSLDESHSAAAAPAGSAIESAAIGTELLIDGVCIFKIIKTKSKPKKAKIAVINNQNRESAESRKALDLLSDAEIQNVEFHLDAILAREKHNRLTDLISAAARAVDEIAALLAEAATEKHFENLNRLQAKLDEHLKQNPLAGEQHGKRKRPA